MALPERQRPGVMPSKPSRRKNRGAYISQSSLARVSDFLANTDDNNPIPETPAARANKKQHGPPFREVTIELAIADGSAFVETTILHPSTNHEPSNPLARSTNRLAVFVHPWPRAGGNAHDPVLLSLSTTFIRRDWHVALYNSRGVGNSGGSPSFTGLAEAQDLQTVVDQLLQEIEDVEEVIVLGYSFGSLAASMHPSRLKYSPERPHIRHDLVIRHVLLSYPLSVMWLLTLFHTSTYTKALRDLILHAGSEVLVIYGDKDQFTASAKYEAWKNELKHLAQSDDHSSPGGDALGISASSGSSSHGVGGKLSVYKAAGGDHFWRGQHLREIRGVIADWLDRKPVISPATPVNTR